MTTFLYLLANKVFFFFSASVLLAYFAVDKCSYTLSDENGDINAIGYTVISCACLISLILAILMGIFSFKYYHENVSRSEKFRSSNVSLLGDKIKHAITTTIFGFLSFMLTIISICMFALSFF